MRFPRPVLLLALAAAAACRGAGDAPREPAAPAGDAAPSPAPAPEAPRSTPSATGVEPETAGLLERLLGTSIAADEPLELDPDDPRPLCLELGILAGLGPFRAGGHELPPAAAELALSAALRARFALGGPLRGPHGHSWEEIGAGLETESLTLPPDDRLRERLRERGGDYLLAAWLERLEHRRVTLYLASADRYEARERGRLRLDYELFDLADGSRACTGRIDRTYDLTGLPPGELASAERLLADEAARLLVAELEACLADARSGQERGD